MLKRLDSEEFTWLWALYEIDPWGGLRGDMQAASINRFLHWAHKATDSPLLEQSQCMPEIEPPAAKPEPTKAELVKKALALPIKKKGK